MAAAPLRSWGSTEITDEVAFDPKPFTAQVVLDKMLQLSKPTTLIEVSKNVNPKQAFELYHIAKENYPVCNHDSNLVQIASWHLSALSLTVDKHSFLSFSTSRPR